MKHLVTYTMAKTQDIYKINAKCLYVCYKKFLNLCRASKSVIMSGYRHYQENLMLFCW